MVEDEAVDAEAEADVMAVGREAEVEAEEMAAGIRAATIAIMIAGR